jgi:hypothetical protein
VTLPVNVLLNRGAFDESGGLWVSYAGTRVARLTPEQLTLSTGPGSPTVPEVLVTQDALDTDLRIALYPAPAGLPLYHSLP